MRRVFLLILLLLVPALAVGPAMVRAKTSPSSSGARHTPIVEHGPKKKTCPKKGQRKPKNCKSSTTKKPKATPTPKKKKTKPKPATPVRTATPRRTATTVPTATATSTPTVTPTVTLTPTPDPATAQIAVQSDVPIGYVAAFIVCGLPSGVTASFEPNPVTSELDYGSPTGGAAHTVLTLSSAWQVAPNQFGLEIWAQYEDDHGNWVATPLGALVSPHSVVLTVSAGNHATVSPAAAVPASGFQNCSPLPSEFHPAPTPTISPSQVTVTASVSNPHPAAGETVQVTVQLKGAGLALPYVPVHVAWYGPQPISACDTMTNSSGIATCSRVNSNPLHGYTVLVQVTFTYNGQTYTSYTSYTM